MSDKSLSTEQKLNALNAFKEPPPGKSGASELATEVSELSNAQLRERASRFTAQLREFEAQYKVEDRRADVKTAELRRQLISIVADKDKQRARELWETRYSAGRWLRALVVRGPRPAMHTACLC